MQTIIQHLQNCYGRAKLLVKVLVIQANSVPAIVRIVFACFDKQSSDAETTSLKYTSKYAALSYIAIEKN